MRRVEVFGYLVFWKGRTLERPYFGKGECESRRWSRLRLVALLGQPVRMFGVYITRETNSNKTEAGGGLVRLSILICYRERFGVQIWKSRRF